MPIEQSGLITPQHLAVWVTDSVLKDGGTVVQILTAEDLADIAAAVAAAILAIPYVTVGHDALATDGRALAVANGLSLTDGGAGGTVTVAIGAVPLITVGDTTSIEDARALSAANGLGLTDGGAGGSVTIAQEPQNTAAFALDWPVSNDCAWRIAAGVDGLSYGVVYYGGNGGWLYDPFNEVFRPARIPGAFLIVDLTNCIVNGVPNQSRVAGTQYYIYAYFAADGDLFATYEISTTAPTTGDPLGATVVTGWHMKNDGTRNKRLVGFCVSDAAGVFWRAGARGVYMSGISSYYQRQDLNYHMHVGGGGHSNTAWQEINSNQYLSAAMWDDGDEPFIGLAGAVSNTIAGAKVHIGVSIDGENPPYDVTPGGVYCDVANEPEQFSIIVTGGDFSTALHTYRIFMKVSAGAGTLLADSQFAMKLEQ